MKTKLLFLLLFISVHVFAQNPIQTYHFTNGNFTNQNTLPPANGDGNLVKTGTSSTPVQDRFGVTNNAIQLNTDQLLSNPVTNTYAQDITISFWIKSNTTNLDRDLVNIIASGGNSDGNYIKINQTSTNEIGWKYACDQQIATNQLFRSKYTAFPTPVFNNQWHHIAIKRYRLSAGYYGDRITTEFFIDGVKISALTDVFTYSYPSAGYTNFLSGSNITFRTTFSDTIDDIDIYNSVLTDAQINTLAQNTPPPVVTIPDANFKAVLVANTLINTNADTEIQVSEANSFNGSIIANNQNIADATGLEAFPNLTELNLSQNNLNTIDLNNNTSVSILNLSNNNLQTLFLIPNTSLTSINVSNNNLSLLDIRNSNTNNITSLNTIGNSSLNCIKISDVAYATTNFTNIDSQTSFGDNCNQPVYVDKNATGANNGLTWADAYTSLTDALANRPSDIFWLKAGTYIPGTARIETFTLTDNQEIYGGFNGTETDISQRNIIANPTILSGDINGDDAIIFSATDANRAENSYRILTISGDNTIIDGFEITSANANGSNTEQKEGSGINITGSYITSINNCQFTKHTLDRAGIIKSIDVSGSIIININNTIFKDNQSVFATCFYGRSANGTINLSVEGSLFTNNTATTNNGASLIWLRQDASGTQNLDIINSTFADNTLNSGTPVITYLSSVPSVNISNSIFWFNLNSNGTQFVDALQTGTSGSISNSISNNSFSGNSNTSNTSNSNPLFTDAATGDYTLQSSSPAVDTGDNSFVTSTTDLAGNLRIFNTTVDMGAYEYNSTLSTSNLELDRNKISLYPNPTHSTLNIKSYQSIESAKVYTLLGQEVLKTNAKTIDVSNLPNGVYLIQISDLEGNQHVKRFIKK
ncbi:T9SS type A sorting domain-containing protein [Psychroserpens damuponensis]|uniref:T9SS type A sorting domain-containing protein n=1 Tax=Psychroserpens damuponensis TaxID=943936 RepID=UPI00058CB346|nr:T9SS type A sorting domain-containing protein [Psychroserpens damuponensis]